jgi:hypothetical protein
VPPLGQPPEFAVAQLREVAPVAALVIEKLLPDLDGAATVYVSVVDAVTVTVLGRPVAEPSIAIEASGLHFV